jgi:hypothetical protein
MAKFSTGLRNTMLGDSSLANAVEGYVIRIYAAATAPASADDALGAATLLTTITTPTGLSFDTPAVDGVLSKAAAEVWAGVNVATGTAKFFRMQDAADTDDASTTAIRIQGTVALAGGDINLSSLGLTSGATQTLNSFNIALPTL